MQKSQKNTKILQAVNLASMKWQEAFNRADAAGCAAMYEQDAIMHARPFGTYSGASEIQAFWQNLMQEGYKDIEYINPQISVVDDNTAVLMASWTMNKARGVIHRELWVLQPDGNAKLREDDFEAEG